MSLATIRSGQPSPSASHSDHAQRLAHRPLAGAGLRPLLLGHEDPGRLGHVLEPPAVDVAVEGTLRPLEVLRGHERPLPVRERRVDRPVDGRRPRDVVADEQVESAVAVVVDERGRRAERDGGAQVTNWSFDATGRPPGPPTPAASVTSTNFFPSTLRNSRCLPTHDDEDVRAAVVVEVADRDAHAVQRDVQPDRRGHVLELHAAEVAVELERRALGLHRRIVVARPDAAVDEEEIGLAVAVVVDDRDPAAHRLGQQLEAGVAVLVAEPHPAGGGHVGEGDRRNLPRLPLLRPAGAIGVLSTGGFRSHLRPKYPPAARPAALTSTPTMRRVRGIRLRG